MKILLMAVCAVFIQGLAPSCEGQKPQSFYGGNALELMNDCRKVEMLDRGEQNAIFDVTRCGSYIEGVADGVSMAKTIHPGDVFFCLPEHISMEELTRVVAKYGNNHPEELHLLAILLVVNALKQAYPCAAK